MENTSQQDENQTVENKTQEFSPPEVVSPQLTQAPPKSNRKKILMISVVALMLVIAGGTAWALIKKPVSPAVTSNTQTQSENKEQETKLNSYWTYKNDKDSQIYLYNTATNESKPYLKLAENEQVLVSPDGKQLVRTRDNLIEVAGATNNPDFKQIYADPDKSISVGATWLPDSSGFIVNARKLTNPEARREGYWVPRYLDTVTRINSDGSQSKKMFDYPVTWGAITIEGIDLKRDEIYLSESGEGGLRLALGVYRLSDGAKLKTYDEGDNSEPLPVANGKAYKSKSIRENSTYKEKVQIIEVSLDGGQEKVIYESLTTEGRSFTRATGGEFSEGISVRTLKLSSDGTSLYFDEIHNLQKSITKLKALNLSDNKVKEIYTPSMNGSYITVETLAANSTGLIGRVSCGGCTTEENEKLGSEYLFIDSSSSKWQLIQKTTFNNYLEGFQPILISE